MERIAVILNPHSRRNRTRTGRVERLQRIVGDTGEVVETRALDELGPALRGALGRGADTLVADGGDGSLHWVVNEARAARGDAHLPSFVPTNGGTIDFVAKKSGIAGNAESILRGLAERVTLRRPPEYRELDSMEITGTTPDGRTFRRMGFALAAGGVGARFFDRYYAEPTLGAPAIVRIVARAVASHVASRLPLAPEGAGAYARELFRPTQARVIIDGREIESREHGALHAGAFDVVLGGLFRVFPLAREPGVLHFQAGSIGPGEIIGAIPSLVRGGAIPGKSLIEVAGSEMRVEATGGEFLHPVVDGERFGPLTSLTVRRGPSIRIPRV